MAYNGRNQQRMQARINRYSGQPVSLLIPSTTDTSTATPFRATSSNLAVDLSVASKVKLYATVRWLSGEFVYGEGGQTLQKVATVEVPADWAQFVVQAYAVQLADGEVLLKQSQALNESGTLYTMKVVSHIGTKQ